MKQRPIGFLSKDSIDQDSEQFDYIVELHEYLWRFVRAEFPGASGKLDNYVDSAIERSEGRAQFKKDEEKIRRKYNEKLF